MREDPREPAEIYYYTQRTAHDREGVWVSGLKLRGTNVGGGQICHGAGGWEDKEAPPLCHLVMFVASVA
jgi:hypothetical protein